MSAIDTLMKRFGFVRLARYGLVLTSEGRIMSLRPVVLDDGLGGRIVGWPDGDLAAMELQKWEPAKPAPVTAVATRVAAAPIGTTARAVTSPAPQKKGPVPISVAAEKGPGPISTVAASVVAPPEQVDEDDWEWEIALARARVAAEEAEQAATAAAQPKLAVVKIPPRELPQWEETQPVTTIDYEDRTSPTSEVVQLARLTNRPVAPALPPAPKALAPAKPAQVIAIPPRAGTAPPTVIPIPKLPAMKERASQIQPVVAPATRASRTRMAKGTGPVIQNANVAPEPLPAAARPIAMREQVGTLPSIKRVAR